MKTRFKGVIAFSLFLSVWMSGFGQRQIYENSKFGADSASRMECAKNISLYRQYFKQDNIKDAYPFWRRVVDICPKASLNTFIDGANIYKYFIETQSDPEMKNAYVDSLMWIYDLRMANYPTKKGYVLGRKGRDFLKYKNSDIADIEKGYKLLEESINLRDEKSDPGVMALLMSTSENLFKAGKMSNEKVIENYQIINDIINEQEKVEGKTEELETLKNAVDEIFGRSGAGTCKSLIPIFSEKFSATPNDIELLKKIAKFLGDADCTNSKLFFDASENLHKLEPSSSSAYNLARMAKEKREIQKAATYYKQAIEMSDDNTLKSRYYVELSDITYRELGNPSAGRDYAVEAAKLDPTNGTAYLLMGHIYANTKCGDENFEGKALYWLAVDMYAQANATDPSLADDANKYIATYSPHFPDKDAIFFNDMKEGDSFQIGCWVNKSTKIRAKN